MAKGTMTNFKGLMLTPEGISPATYRAVVTGASAAYGIKRDIPTIEEIGKYCTARPATISRVLSTPEFKALMRQRGFPFDTAKLTPEQYFAVSVLTDPTNRKPLGAKLKQAGVTHPQYRAWLKQPHFRDYINKITEDMLGEHIGDVHTAVMNKAVSGDLQAAKMVYELTGRHDPNKQQMIDLQGVIGLLLEIITRYVTDTRTLASINNDIGVILSGGTPKALEQFDVSRIAESSSEIEDAVVIMDENQPIGDIFEGL